MIFFRGTKEFIKYVSILFLKYCNLAIVYFIIVKHIVATNEKEELLLFIINIVIFVAIVNNCNVITMCERYVCVCGGVHEYVY